MGSPSLRIWKVIFAAAVLHLPQRINIQMVIRETYEKLIEQYQREVEALQRKININSFVRLAVFVLLVVALIWGYQYYENEVFWLVPIWLTGFIILVRVTTGFTEKRDFAEALRKINEDEVRYLDGDFSNLRTGQQFVDPAHPYSHDLDVFGQGSLFQRVSRTVSESGELLLAGWLQNPMLERKEILDRQEAVKELTNELDWRQKFRAFGNKLHSSETDRADLLNWAAEDSFFRSQLLVILSFVLSAITIVAMVLVGLGIIPWWIVGILYLVNLRVVGSRKKDTGALYDKVAEHYQSLAQYAAVLKHIEDHTFQSPLNQQWRDSLNIDGQPPSQRIDVLSRILKLFEMRSNSFAILFLNGVLLWDLHSVRRLENWKKQNRNSFGPWFDGIAYFDTINSLANFAANHPNYTYPHPTTEDKIIYHQVGHPFLDPDICVSNDLVIDQNRINIVTGANMAGKSTFLRAIGLNMILAMAGAPVYAARFNFYPIRLYTSLRTTDSVLDGESYFFAELKRLQGIIKAYESGERLFVLLDEILKGTNSKDQHLGAKGMVERLHELNGVGICATHDIDLAKWGEEAYPETLRNFCFEITMEQDELIFDYTLKPGICQHMNASILLRKRGIIR